MRRNSRKVISSYSFVLSISSRDVKITCEYKRCKYLKIKLLGENELLLITPTYANEKEATSIINKYMDKVIKILNTKKIVLEEGQCMIFGVRYNVNEIKDLKKMYKDALSEIEVMFERIREKYHFPKTTLYLRKMRSRWGVCYPNEKKVGLSTYLLSLPIALIEYVILHELCHLKYPNHSKDFYLELSKYCPDHRKLKKDLKMYNTIM